MALPLLVHDGDVPILLGFTILALAFFVLPLLVTFAVSFWNYTEYSIEAVRRLIGSGTPLMVCKTVLLEFEWVMRGYYKFSAAQIANVMHHLLSLPQVTIEARASVVQALSHCEATLRGCAAHVCQ